MNRLKKKLNSERGASITWALLIFLVCAVVGSAVLVAGTAASGRMSKAAENDQRYYAVNSAARLLIKKIDGQTVTIIKDGDTYTDGNSDTVLPGEGFTSIPLEAAYYLASNNASRPAYTISLSAAESGDKTALNVTANEELTVDSGTNDEGGMVLTITSNEQSENAYSLKVYFNVDKDMMVVDDKEIYQYTWHIRNIEVVGSQRW